MPARKSSGRGGTATMNGKRSQNQTTRSGRISESDISRMRVDEIRAELRSRGVTGTSGLRKPELASTLAKTLRVERGGAKKSTGPKGQRAAAGPVGAKARQESGVARQGKGGSKSLRYAQVISSPEEKPERPGRSLVTTNHEVIRRWARARGAKPATIAGTEREGRPGVLTFNFPGFRESERIRQVTWDAWFRTFDERGLNLLYQEQLRDGRQSNFFRTENPSREDG